MATHLQKDADDPILDITLSGADKPAIRIRGASDSSVPALAVEQVGSGSALSVTGDASVSGTLTAPTQAVTDLALANDLTIAEGGNVILGTTTGTKIGTATTQKLGFYNATPIVKQTGVAVTAEAVHAALVALGLIGA